MKVLTRKMSFPTGKEASTGGIAIYWGQNNSDDTLSSSCHTGNYEIVNLAFLSVFSCGRS
ncbi:hypothetical protein JHK87_028864 [Glycine soja]|nr:hypothetical protein JHK87_028864 [Glycine soja]